MVDDKSQAINIAGLVIGLIALNLMLYGQFNDPQTGIIIVFGVVGFIAFYFVVSYLITNLIVRLKQIQNNEDSIFEIKKDLNRLKDNINMIEGNAKLDARLSFLESKMKNKRGQIDPRIVILAIIVFLLVLYARTKGWI